MLYVGESSVDVGETTHKRNDGLPFWVFFVPYAAGVLQTRPNKGEVGLNFNTFWAKIKITFDETKGPVSPPYNVLYMKAPI